ncbi:MAG: T9SS type A sorting domain-containing protein [Candidatus Eisenbacteria bacterium]|uniref:T9SS type A sorting domain-containing protein n=1 Tax=Eiseniibacteriota bacterium TaxID=2212470 RepID=A0A956NF42_UNCEI|nr:T9SS type A sorting domain-containing protein [Candidatus Eisenbacteria bacterium]
MTIRQKEEILMNRFPQPWRPASTTSRTYRSAVARVCDLYLVAMLLLGGLCLASSGRSALGGTTPEAATALEGPAVERDYFDQWHWPHGAVLDPALVAGMWQGVQRVGVAGAGSQSTEPWRFLGPFGMSVAGGHHYSGRLLDIDGNSPTLRFASASGGLWEYFLFIPIPLTETLSSQAIGTVATDPLNEDHMFAGTGEGRMRSGTGLWETWDRGVTWSYVPLPDQPSACYRVRYVPGRPTHLFAATTAGLFKSTDNGLSWTVSLGGEIPDLAIWPHDPDRMWVGRWGDAVYESTDAGATWVRVVGAGLPTSNVGRVALTVHPGFPAIVYASIARQSDGGMLGVYRSLGGSSWTNVSPPEDFLTPQGGYDNVLAVSPEDWQRVLIGGVSAWLTQDGGLSWTRIADPDMHADIHAILWRDGSEVWVGHDGGFCYSGDAGLNWASDIDVLPTVQFYNIDVGDNEPNVMGGGTQDNGITMTLDGAVWSQEIPQDGSGFVVGVRNPVERLWATWGPRGGNWLFPPTRTGNRGASWEVHADGIDPNQQWWTEITHDHVDPVYLYSYAGGYVYRSLDDGLTWQKLNTTPFSWTVDTFAVTRWQPGGSKVWAATASGQSHQLHVWDGSSWIDRTAGLPNGRRIRRVTTVDFAPETAYVLMQGIASGAQAYRTFDLGATWTNITGDLPAVPVGDIVQHPTNSNLLYLGTEMGCFRSTNGGTNWLRWNDGMPEANIVTDFATIDSLETVGRYYIVAGTYGRGLWKREVSSEDPAGIEELRENLTAVQLSAPRPHPARGRTEVTFSLRSAAEVTLEIFDVNGRRIRELLNEQRSAGSHTVPILVDDLPSGVFVLRLRAGDHEAARRLVVAR